MQIKLRRAILARAKRQEQYRRAPHANIFQGQILSTDVVIDYARLSKLSRQPRTLTASGSLRPCQRSTRQTIHIGHALGSGFVQSIFSSPPRRPPFKCFPSVSRRVAKLKILCSIPLTEYCPFRERIPNTAFAPLLKLRIRTEGGRVYIMIERVGCSLLHVIV